MNIWQVRLLLLGQFDYLLRVYHTLFWPYRKKETQKYKMIFVLIHILPRPEEPSSIVLACRDPSQKLQKQKGCLVFIGRISSSLFRLHLIQQCFSFLFILLYVLL